MDMKLGLLVALAVVAVATGPSDGRNVTECELRQALATAMVPSSHLQKFKDNILATGVFDPLVSLSILQRLRSGFKVGVWTWRQRLVV